MISNIGSSKMLHTPLRYVVAAVTDAMFYPDMVEISVRTSTRPYPDAAPECTCITGEQQHLSGDTHCQLNVFLRQYAQVHSTVN